MPKFNENILANLKKTESKDEDIQANLKKEILADENIITSLSEVHLNANDILTNLKKIIFQSQNINSSLMSSPVFSTIHCLTERDGSIINDGEWQFDATPYFYWDTLNWYFPIVGWDISMDEDLDDEIDKTQHDIIIDGSEAFKGSGDWGVDLTKLQYQNKYEIYEIESTTKTLEPAHSTYDRYDVIYLDLDTESIGIIEIEKGLRAVSPTVPTPDSNHYLEICKILVRGGDTQIYNADITDLRDQKIEIIEYVEEGLDAGSHTLKIRAIGINGVKSQIGAFNIKITNQDYEIAPIKIWKTSSKIIQLANGEYQTTTDTPYLTWEDPNPTGVVLTYYITTDGTEPSTTNYRWSTTNLYYNITDHLGEGTTNIKIKPIDNFDVAGKTETVTFVYGVESIEDDIVAIINGSTYRQSEKEIQIHQVVMSLDNPWTCSFSLPTKKFDDSTSINNDDDIQIYYNEILLFNGWIKELSRIISTDGETITGRAIGVKGILNKTTWVHNDSSYHEYKEANKSVADRFNDILRDIPGYLIADKEGISQMDNKLTEEKYAAVKIKPTLDSLIDKAGNYKYFIDQYKKFKVMNLDNLTSHNLYLAVEGENISAHKHDPAQSGDYDITGSDLKFDTTGKYTRIVIEGAKKQYQGWCGTMEWLQPVEKGQPNKTTQFQMYVEPGHKVLGSLYNPPGASASIYASWRIAHHWDCSSSVSHKGTQYIKYNRVIQGAINVETKTGSVGVSSETYKKYCPDPSGLLEGPIPDELKKFRPANVMVYAAYERPERIKVSVGDPNAPKEKTLYILDEGFMYQRWYRDDTSLMTDYANKILAAKNYTKINGQISLDAIYTEISLDKCINIQNSNYSELENLKAIIQNITFNFDRYETTLDLTTDYLGGLNTGLASQGGKIKTGGAPRIEYGFRRG